MTPEEKTARDRAYARAYYQLHKEAILARNRANRRKNPAGERTRKRVSLLDQYGITPAQFDAMVLEQGGCCAICDKPAVLAVDHDHNSGQVGGLLCLRCNLGLSTVERYPVRAVEYLRRRGTL